MLKKRYFVKVEGIVQGVGFRPFVYNLALSHSLSGWVNNNSEGVYIDIEGAAEALDSFLHQLEFNPPPLAKIENIKIEEKEPACYSSFIIKDSVRDESKITLISPDIATCSDCLKDIWDPSNKRYKYPFTNCTNCGPRFSIIKTIPYDRNKTTMEKFKLCESCHREYEDPINRRFHAQPNACDACGPHLSIADKSGKTLPHKALLRELYNTGIFSEMVYNDTDLIIKWTQQKLKEGAIIALKGLTGFNLVCDATNEKAVEVLRNRKKRPAKPFAVMMNNLKTAKKYCKVNRAEEMLLTGIKKPIVLLSKNPSVKLPPSVAPKQNSLGVMLPNTPLHELLMGEGLEVLIMTSANIHGLPLQYINVEAVEKLNDIVDYFLMHDRDIYLPVDDSVSKVVLAEERVIRRARGYAPEPIKLKGVKPILACGSNMKNTFAVAKGDFVFMSQHNGDLENLESFEHYKNNIEHFKKIFQFQPEYIAADMHPQYASTKYAVHSELPLVQVQHHHAHIASCLVENGINHKVIGIAFDGTGYGPDGCVWGGEYLICDLKEFERAGHLGYVKMPGGEKAIKEPWRMAVSYLSVADFLIDEDICSKYGSEASSILKMLHKNINCIETSSMGRLFDAVSSILGICDVITYEGQASMELEAVINPIKCTDYYKYKILQQNGSIILDVRDMIKEIWMSKSSGVEASLISQFFHNTIVKASVDICKLLREHHKLNEVALSGGVFQNSYLLENMLTSLEKESFKVYTHKLIPSNDGGISLGQLAVANEILKESGES